MDKVKVLYFVDRMLRGGIQTFVLENLKHMDRDLIQIDFLLLDDGVDYALENELRDLGSNVYKLKGIWVKTPLDYFKYHSALNKFFKEHHNYTAVHLHSSSKNYIVLSMAKKYGIKTRIAHSHNIGFQTNSKAKIMVGNLLKFNLLRNSTEFFACSEEAGRWLFGDNKEVTVIKNAVDIDRYRFNEVLSKHMKAQLGLKQNLVIGHTGRFTHQKNHSFLIDIFEEIYRKEPNAKLILVGTGELESEIREKVFQKHLSEAVLFIGFKENVSDYMQAIDLFVFPSKFEGLGLVLIEAQASGLRCFTSADVVPQEAKVSNLLTYISLKESPEYWADRILDVRGYVRETPEADIRNHGYDIKDTASYLQNFYLSKK